MIQRSARLDKAAAMACQLYRQAAEEPPQDPTAPPARHPDGKSQSKADSRLPRRRDAEWPGTAAADSDRLGTARLIHRSARVARAADADAAISGLPDPRCGGTEGRARARRALSC